MGLVSGGSEPFETELTHVLCQHVGMKKKTLTHRESNIVATVEAEMKESRLTESVHSELFDLVKDTATDQK